MTDNHTETAPPDFSAFPPIVDPEPEPVPVGPSAQDATERALRHRAEIFVELSKVDSFQELMREKDRKIAKMNKDFAAGLLAGQEVNQRQVDYDRGFIHGLEYLDKVIEAAHNKLARIDRERESRVEEPDDTMPGGF